MNLECQMSATTTTRTIAGGHSNSNKGNDNDNDSASVMNARAKVAVRQAIGQLDESECMNTRIHTYLHMYVHTREQLYLRLLVQVGRCCKVGGQHFFYFLFFFLPILLSFTLAGATRFVGVVNYVKQEINAHLHAKNKTNEVKNGKYRKSV